eukprot:gb/GFBE01053673.1/.p1 GENE.gb/GFBE01053673.1/~~gb/GFBE01053673.1/.p1  ORF type:complete len:182 (+),score=42.00 gb/GFBE01053673.1/:1-546(+)
MLVSRVRHIAGAARSAVRQTTRTAASARRLESDPFSADSRHNVFAQGPVGNPADPASSVFQSLSHEYRKQEPRWRELALGQKPPPVAEADTVLRKRLRHQARGRGWMEAAEFLSAYCEATSNFSTLPSSELRELDRLLRCDDMFLMRLAASRTAVPEELNTAALRRLQSFFQEQGSEELNN